LLPISLTLRNFLSYRDAAPTLRLEDVHVACLCGPNGHGKSALLDAITWTLWGRARGQRQEQLLHHGQEEMIVELEFDVRGERYKAVRRYSKARRSAQSSLELSVATGAEYRPITGDTIGVTQAHITRLIAMDYDTFVNSAFLVQGRADLFTMSTPAQRKEVLSHVLGLGLYDRLEERAKLHGREVQGQLSASEHTVTRLKERVGNGDAVRAELALVDEGLQAAQASVASLAERLDLLRGQVSQLEQRRAEGVELDARSVRAVQRRSEAERDSADLERRIGEWQKAIERETEIDEGFAALGRAREHLRALNTAAQKLSALQAELLPLQQRITEARAGLELDVSVLKHRIESELQPRIDEGAGIDERIAGSEKALAALEVETIQAAQAAEQHQVLALEVRGLAQQTAALEEQGKETAAKLALLDHHHEEGQACPLCGTLLEPDARGRIKTAYDAEIEAQRSRYRETSARSKEIGERAAQAALATEGTIQRLDAERRRLDAERGQLAALRGGASEAATRMEQARAELAAASERLEREEYSQEEQVAAQRLRSQIGELAFDPHAANAAELSARELEHWDTDHQGLTQAKTRLPEDEAAQERTHGRAREAVEELGRIESKRTQIAAQLTELPGYEEQLAVVDREHAQAQRQRDELQEHRGGLAHQLEEIAAAEIELVDAEAQRGTMAHDAGVYGELALAFGKGGVQALLIEAAIPRLEDEANDLLKQMTDGRMTLKLETQRARRTGPAAGGDTVETLEVLIADELGTRNYEMFSGGERFRVDFALRIALSKLLAWRAGAPLPTLFIDEGFGTQDAEGRDKILDVIKAIEDRFERILVITHMDEVKEAFPVRIEVSRTSAGSTFSLS
jgi:exonuclease SbcC